MLNEQRPAIARFKAAVFGALGVFALLAGAPAAQSQSQPGRFLVSPRRESVVECNVDASSCFNVVGSSMASGDPSGGNQDVAAADEPSIANNGTIAFTAIWSIDGTCVLGGQGICGPHVFLMDAGGTNVRQITFNPANATSFGGDNYASISPDGTMVAFVSNRNPASDGSYHVAVYVVNSDGSGLRQVTPFTYDAGGNAHGNMFSVAWSPDSKRLTFKGSVYTSFCGTFFGSPIEAEIVGLINVDGTGGTYLACDNVNAAGSGFAIDWSPDGTLIAHARNSINFGEPAIAIIDLSGQGRFASGLTTAQLGNQSTFGGEVCPTDRHCLHFSPDGTRLAYENNSPSDNPSFYGISTINLAGTVRSDSAAFGTRLETGIWWAPGAALPAAAQITLAPNPVEVWPGFSQQLTPTLLDANNNLILHTARTYNVNYVYAHSCSVEIGPYGLVMFRSIQSGFEGSTISAGNEGLASNNVSLKCWASPPCTYTISAVNQNFSSSGGSDSIGVFVNSGSSGSSCPWTGASNASWITVTSGSSGSGNGSVSFTVAANTGAARQGTITIAGQTFTVTQDQAGGTVGSLVVIKEDYRWRWNFPVYRGRIRRAGVVPDYDQRQHRFLSGDHEPGAGFRLLDFRAVADRLGSRYLRVHEWNSGQHHHHGGPNYDLYLYQHAAWHDHRDQSDQPQSGSDSVQFQLYRRRRFKSVHLFAEEWRATDVQQPGCGLGLLNIGDHVEQRSDGMGGDPRL
jgi:Putative binding domain, N-terminal/WD40-like Beta Propeller Repeat